MTTAIPKDWCTMKEVAEWMAVSDETVRRWIADKKLPAFRCEGTTRIREQALLEFILEHSTI